MQRNGKWFAGCIAVRSRVDDGEATMLHCESMVLEGQPEGLMQRSMARDRRHRNAYVHTITWSRTQPICMQR